MTSSHAAVTSYLLGNLHCPSCVALISSLLQSTYEDRVRWISPNLVTSMVTVEHEEKSVSFVRAMARTLEQVGFEICGVESTVDNLDSLQSFGELRGGEIGSLSPCRENKFGVISRLWRPRTPLGDLDTLMRDAHLKHCHACRIGASTQQSIDDKDPRMESRSSSPNLGSPAPVGNLDGVVTGTISPNGPWRATLSVGGMTCAVCVNTVTAELEAKPWVTRVRVSLLTNSATVDFTDHGKSLDIVEVVDGLGYDASLDAVIDLREKQSASYMRREVEIKIDGMFCSRCPSRVSTILQPFGLDKCQVLREASIKQPLIKLRYCPSAPHFTIRHILLSIEAIDPSLRASVYHPPTLEERSKIIMAKHRQALLWRTFLALVTAIPSFVLGIVYMSLVPDSDTAKQYLMKPCTSGLIRLEIILFALATPVYFFGADVFHIRAIKELQTLWRSGSRASLAQRFYRFGSMNLLISLGTTIAYFSSVAQMLVAAAAEDESKVPEDRFYFDSVIFLTLFLLSGRLIEAHSKSKTGSAVEALGKLRPSTALLVETNTMGKSTTRTVNMDQLEENDVVRVPHGTSPAADGIVLTGESTFDESSLTGESRPIQKQEGDAVFAGTVNQGSALTLRVTSTSGKSMLDQIVEVVREGQTKRAPVEQIADLLTSYFVPVVTLIAIVTWLVWTTLALTNNVGGEDIDSSGGRIAFALQFAIAVFVVACPCGLALAAPTAIFVGGGIAATRGILVKGGGEAFEKASKIDCVVFDKTGTLTLGGEQRITDSIFLTGRGSANIDKNALLAGLKAAEENSSHPIAKAVVAFCGAETTAADLADVDELPGRGMIASFKHKTVQMAVGNEALMRDLSFILPIDVGDEIQSWKAEARSIALVAVKEQQEGSWELAAALSISDPIREDAVSVITALQARGTQTWMLSGDNVITAQAVAERVGIPSSNVLAEVLPSEKAAKVSYLQATLGCSSPSSSPNQRAMVAMVGDGINDAPALTTADIGIAIGSGSDVVISSADFVLATSRLTAVLTLLDLSRAVLRRIRLNFVWAIIYNLIALPVAAGCLYAVKTESGSHVRLDPVWASLAMALSSISVVLSSLSLRSQIPGLGFRGQGGLQA